MKKKKDFGYKHVHKKLLLIHGCKKRLWRLFKKKDTWVPFSTFYKKRDKSIRYFQNASTMQNGS